LCPERAQDNRRRRERFYLVQYVRFLGSCGIRVGEARRLRWRDISSTTTEDGSSVIVLRVSGKTGGRDVICDRFVSPHVLRELSAFRQNELGVSAVSPDEVVFCHLDGSPVESFKKGFQNLLGEAGLLFSSEHQKRVPYSLRHAYATMRLSAGVNVFQLSANMGTSIEMLDQYYGHRRVRDPKNASELTKTRS
jgi:integrase